MAHMLAKLRGVKAAEIKKVLMADAAQHAEQGLHLEHLWQNADNLEEVFFLFAWTILARREDLFKKCTHKSAKKILTVICR